MRRYLTIHLQEIINQNCDVMYRNYSVTIHVGRQDFVRVNAIQPIFQPLGNCCDIIYVNNIVPIGIAPKETHLEVKSLADVIEIDGRNTSPVGCTGQITFYTDGAHCAPAWDIQQKTEHVIIESCRPFHSAILLIITVIVGVPITEYIRCCREIGD